MSGIDLLALVVMGMGWCLGGPQLVGPAIGGVVCVAVAMVENRRLVRVKSCGMVEGWWVHNRRSTGLLQASKFDQEQRCGMWDQDCKEWRV